MKTASLHKGHIAGIRRFIDSLSIDADGLVEQTDSKAWLDLDNVLLTNEPWATHFTSIDAGIVCLHAAYQAVDENKTKDKSIDLDIWRNRVFEIASEVISSIPIEYDCYFSLPCIVPAGNFCVPLSESVGIVVNEGKIDGKNFDTHNLLRSLVEARGGIFSSTELKSDAVYLHIRIRGFVDDSLSSTAATAALSTVKQFIALALIAGVLRPVTGIIKRGRISEIQKAPTHDTPHWLFSRRNDTANSNRQISAPPDLGQFVKQLDVDLKSLFTWLPNKAGKTLLEATVKRHPESEQELAVAIFQNFDLVTNFFSLKNSRDKERISSALEWYTESQVTTNQTLSLIYLCIGLEAILGDDEKSREQQLTSKLADRVAYLLGSVSSERDKWRQSFKDIYDARSKLVHARKANLERHDAGLVDNAKSMLRQVIARELNSLQKHSRK